MTWSGPISYPIRVDAPKPEERKQPFRWNTVPFFRVRDGRLSDAQ